MFSSEKIEKVSSDELFGTLNDIERKFAPSELFIVGNRFLSNNHKSVSIIGSRNPSMKGIENAKRITKFLVKNRVTIVSGLAKGIDSVAHKTAIENGGITIAVIGTPLDKFYPKENESLQKQIMKDYLAISQFKVGSSVYPSNFPARNRTMALVSQVSIIVEAGEKSGTMHQGWEALRLGRRLFILENLVENKELTWPSKLIEYGAEVLYMNNLDVILDFLPETEGGMILNVTF